AEAHTLRSDRPRAAAAPHTRSSAHTNNIARGDESARAARPPLRTSRAHSVPRTATASIGFAGESELRENLFAGHMNSSNSISTRPTRLHVALGPGAIVSFRKCMTASAFTKRPHCEHTGTNVAPPYSSSFAP